MNPTATAARRRQIKVEAEAVVSSKAFGTTTERMAALDALQAELKTLDAHDLINAKAAGLVQFDSDANGVKGKTSTGFAPLQFAADQTAALFKAAGDGVGITVKALPTTTGTLDPALHTQAVMPPVQVRREPTRVLDLLPTAAMSTGVIEFYTANATGTGAGPTAEGAAKPDAQLAFAKTTVSATKLAVYSSASEESLEDFGAFNQFLQAELVSQIIDAENKALLSGTVAGAQTFAGLLVASGIGTATPSGANAGATALDMIGVAMDSLRAGGRYTSAPGIVLHPNAYGALRRAKAQGSGNYLLGDPTTDARLSIFGCPVVLTTQIPATKALVADFDQVGTVYVRAGLTVRSNSTGSGFRNNITEFIAEERLALAITAPSAACVATIA